MSNIYLTKSKTSLYINSYSSPLPPSKGNLLVNFISLTKRKLSLQFYQSIHPHPSEEIFLMSNIYLTKRITSLYLTSFSSLLPPSKENLLVKFNSLTKRYLSLQFRQSIPSPPSEEFLLVSNIYLTKRIISLYFTSYSSPLPTSK